MYIFSGLSDFVKRGVLTLLDQLPRYSNHHYYYCCLFPARNSLLYTRFVQAVFTARLQS